MDFRCRMTDRIAHVRRQYLRTPIAQRDGHLPATYGNHPTTLHWLEGYLEAKDELTTLLRRSRAEEAEMDRSKVIIMEDELIVGQPDFEMTEAETVRRDELFRMFRMAPSVSGEGRSDHMALDYRKLLRMGVDGLIAEIEEKKSQLTFSPETIGEDFEKDEFYDACLIELHALIRYAARYEARLRELAVEAVPGRKEELLTMADNLARVPKGPAKTFWQALQSMHFFTLPCAVSILRADRIRN